MTSPSERRRILAIVAGWPIPWREVWGRRANDLADSGVPWPEDERQAYDQTEADREAGLDPNLILNPPEETKLCPAIPLTLWE